MGIYYFEDSFPTNTFSTEPNRETIYGICFTPPKCETVALNFLSNGKLCAFQNLELNKELAHLEDDIYLGYLSVKTQYCGSEVHKIIIRLFDYLNNNYFENFECIDEGQYWETRDEKLLQENFDKSSNLINSFESLLEHLPFEADKTIEDYILRMATIVKKKKWIKKTTTKTNFLN